MKRFRNKVIIICSSAFFVLGVLFFNIPKAGSEDAFSFTGQYKKDELLIRFKDEEQGKLTLNSAGIQNNKVTEAGAYKVKVPEGKTIEEFYKEIKSGSNIIYAEPNYIVKMTATPNDNYYGNQWDLPKIGAPSGWDVTQGSASTTIAILDTGIDYVHEDLSSKIWTNPGETDGNSIDDDGNGYVDDYQGFDFCGNQSLEYVPGYGWVWGCDADTYNQGSGKYENDADSAADDHAHGTACAGIAAAETDNVDGVAGIDWNAKIVPLKVLSRDGFGSIDSISAGIDYAAANNLTIASLSLGTYSYSQTLKDSIDNAYSSGVIQVAAAGNEEASQIIYPARFSGVLAVGATNSSDERISIAQYGWGSNYGPELDVVAPGVELYTTDRTGAVGYSIGDYNSGFGGTSGATPHAAGALALLKARVPTKTNAQLMDILRETADEVPGMGGQNKTNYYGYGRININNALNFYDWQYISQGSDKSLTTLSPGESATLTLTAENTGTATWERVGSFPVRVGTSNPVDRASSFDDGTWIASHRPVGIPLGTDTVAPGEQVTFTWTIEAPNLPGAYNREYFNLLAEGSTWMNDPGQYFYISIM